MMEIKDQDLEVWEEVLIPLRCSRCSSVVEEDWEEVLEVWGEVMILDLEEDVVVIATVEIKNLASDLDDSLCII
jgi:DNA-directed RNA polymerase subunit N (RpoN/RPB10)